MIADNECHNVFLFVNTTAGYLYIIMISLSLSLSLSLSGLCYPTILIFLVIPACLHVYVLSPLANLKPTKYQPLRHYHQKQSVMYATKFSTSKQQCPSMCIHNFYYLFLSLSLSERTNNTTQSSSRGSRQTRSIIKLATLPLGSGGVTTATSVIITQSLHAHDSQEIPNTSTRQLCNIYLIFLCLGAMSVWSALLGTTR